MYLRERIYLFFSAYWIHVIVVIIAAVVMAGIFNNILCGVAMLIGVPLLLGWHWINGTRPRLPNNNGYIPGVREFDGSTKRDD